MATCRCFCKNRIILHNRFRKTIFFLIYFHHKQENGEIKFQSITGLGYSNAALQLGSARYDTGENSYVAYDFYATKAGEVSVHTYLLPLFAKDREHGTAYGIQLDDTALVTQSNDVKEYSREWASNVIRNSAINITKFKLACYDR